MGKRTKNIDPEDALSIAISYLEKLEAYLEIGLSKEAYVLFIDDAINSIKDASGGIKALEKQVEISRFSDKRHYSTQNELCDEIEKLRRKLFLLKKSTEIELSTLKKSHKEKIAEKDTEIANIKREISFIKEHRTEQVASRKVARIMKNAKRL